MASIIRHNGRWRAMVAVKGKRPSKVFDTKNEATLWAIEQETVLTNGKATVSGYSVGDAFKRYAKEISPTRKGERWEVVRLNKLGRDRLALIPLERLESEDVQDWIDRQSISAGSILRELNLIQAVLREARRWRWTNTELRDLKKPQEPRHRERLITQAEVEALSVVANKQPEGSKTLIVFLVFQLALETAMRKGEILNLTWENVHLDRRFVHLPDTKTGKPRNVPLSTKAIELLTLMVPKQSGRVFVINSGSFDTLFRKLRKKAKVSGFTFHDTRHTATTRLANKFTLLELARITGHTDPRSLMIYFNATAEELAAKLD